MNPPLRVFLSAGEASGDRFGASLVQAIRSRRPDARFLGIGGARMAAQGVERIADTTRHAVMGVFSAISKVGYFTGVFRQCVRRFNIEAPSVCVPIDNPGFNRHLARFAHSRAVPVCYYVSPQFWAWRKGRIYKFAKTVDRVLCILPFEPAMYEEVGVDARYTGHPALDYLKQYVEDPAVAARVRSLGPCVVGLLPGSRLQEVRNVFPIIASAASHIQRRLPQVRFIVGCAEPSHEPLVRATLRANGVTGATLLTGRAWDVMRHARLCVTASGTATLELAWFRRPMVIVYHAPPIARPIMPWLLRTHFGIVNVIAGREICPEFLMYGPNGAPAGQAAVELLQNEDAWRRQQTALGQVVDLLGAPGSADRAAEAVIELAERRRPR
ncbi:MAG TPA: lipid-A-disaccharide synthase [Candidatus Brocadiia bacterium]|nr:lipid-A-disaccharide synthase [Candidatus Brocadiia bacterium]